MSEASGGPCRRWTLAGAIFTVACGGAAERPGGPPAKPAASAARAKMVTPSRLVPELDIDEIEPWFREEGRAKYLLGGLRILRYDNGAVERADERFPPGSVQAMPLPDRLGGGYLFHQADSQGTRLWRAGDWTEKLVPLAHIGPAALEVVAGFDRLYLRTKPNKLVAIDPERGTVLPLGRLPEAPSYGAMAFADGWRAVVDTELRGPMATFDAGATWRPLRVPERVIAAAVRDDDPVVYVDGGHYRIDARGHVQLVPAEESDEEEPSDEQAEEALPEQEDHPLGDRPLRAAIEHGFPENKRSVVVAYRGALVRVSVPDGTVQGVHPHVLDSEQASCHGARVGAGFGFVCGEPGGPTTIYAFEEPLSLREVARFDGPRFVSPSGNGALAVRGGCAASPTSTAGMRRYCILGIDGSRHEIAVRGEIGSERVVALADGRAVVLVPPRLGRPGTITLIDGDELTSQKLRYPDEPRAAVKIARRGMWLEGFEQRAPDAIGGWVEAGGPAVGVTVSLDGSVKVGKPYDEGGELLMSGSFAFALRESEGALESTDGGKSWKEVEMPRLPESPGDARTRACSPVGCALRGWLRVGWGPPAVAGDLEPAAAPPTVHVKPRVRDPMKLSCQLVGEAPAPDASGESDGESPYSAWSAFRGVPPPKLGRDEVGVDKSSQSYEEVPTHVYVWGPKGADWTRAGWWSIRFEDRFEVVGGVRESMRSRPPWGDENTAADAIGARHRHGYWRWAASLDPSGRAALVHACMSGARCVPYAVAEGRPILPLREAPGANSLSFRKPLDHGVARIGDSWYFLTELPGVEITLWRAELGVMREIGHYLRFDGRRFHGAAETPRLVRRAIGAELGLLVTVAPDPSTGDQVGQWAVLPIDLEDGSLGDPVALGPADLGGKLPRRCVEQHDGWLLDASLATAPAIHLPGTTGFVDDVELRLRIDPGFVCIDAMAARAGRGLEASGGARKGAAGSVPMAVRDRYSGKRWRFSCESSAADVPIPRPPPEAIIDEAVEDF